MVKVFVSHTGDDARWAAEFAGALERSGISTFLRARDVLPGQVTVHWLDEAMGTADAAVLVISDAAVDDPAFRSEYAVLLEQAHQRGMRFLPVLHGTSATRLPPLAGSHLWADFRGLSPAERAAKADLLAASLHRSTGAVPHQDVAANVRRTIRPAGPDPDPAFVVTYAAPDTAYGERLVGWLTRDGLPAWSIAALEWGSPYLHEIRQRIRTSLAMLVVMSPAAEESPDVEREILEGFRHGCEFFPVLLRGDPNFLLASSWYFDARGAALPGGNELRLLRRLHRGERAGAPASHSRAPAGPARVPTAPGAPEPLDRLRCLLAEGELAHADVWTTTLLLNAAGRLDTGWLEPDDSARLPLSLLADIDLAWAEATGGAHGFGRQRRLHRLAGDRGHGLLDAFVAYGWRTASARQPAPRYERFVARAALPEGFFPTLRNPQTETQRAWYDRWQNTVIAVHSRLQDQTEGDHNNAR
ncbi:TIR domain-containing protein [Actinoplanes sp. NPDC049265]|uniref:TIR domain-containing protein n=1 Tax=Actinoplanes sp. NPDC049265 TaxID=3363902 RepID=UPI00371BEC98